MELLSRPQSAVMIRNGHSRLILPSETIRRINNLDSEKQQRIEELFINALQDTSRVNLILEG